MSTSPLAKHGFPTEVSGGTMTAAAAAAAGSECAYCCARATHPRLGRGESYACGYKPYRCEVCKYSTVTKGNLAIHEQSDKHLNNVQDQEQYQKPRLTISPVKRPNSYSLLMHQQWLPCSFSKAPGQEDISPDVTHLQSLTETCESSLICQICGIFTTDNIDTLIAHSEENRIPLDLDLVNHQVTTHTRSGLWHCLLCAYQSPLKANFQLHCRTEKHAQKLGLLVHMMEGQRQHEGLSLKLSCLPHATSGCRGGGGVFCQLGCLACGFSTGSVQKIRAHCQSPGHARLKRVFEVVIRKRCGLKTNLCAAATTTAIFSYKCPECEPVFCTTAALLQHFKAVHAMTPADGFNSAADHVTVMLQTNQNGDRGGNHHEGLLPVCSPFGESSFCSPRDKPTGIDGDTAAASIMCEPPHNSLDLISRNGLEHIENTHQTVAPSSMQPSPVCSRLNSVDGDEKTPSHNDEDHEATASDILARKPVFSMTSEQPTGICSKIIKGLLMGIEEHKRVTEIPRTPESLVAWLGLDFSFFTNLKLMLQSQIPELNEALLNGLTALAIELAAQDADTIWPTLVDLHKLQQCHPHTTCQQCSPVRGFMLTSSATLHSTIHHHYLPFPPPFLIDQLVNAVRETMLLLISQHQQQQQETQSSTKHVQSTRSSTQMTEEQLKILRANLDISCSPSGETVALIKVQTGLKEAMIRYWFRNAALKMHQHSREGHCNLGAVTASDSADCNSNSKEPSTFDTQCFHPTKRMRTAISRHQHDLLVHFFKEEQNPTRVKMDIISEKVGLSKRVVQVWFQNARSRERKQSLIFPSPPTPVPLPRPVLGNSEHTQQQMPQPASTPSTSPTPDLHFPVQLFQNIFNQLASLNIPPLGVSTLTTSSETPLDLTTTTTTTTTASSSNALSSASPRSEVGSVTPNATPIIRPQHHHHQQQQQQHQHQGFTRRNRTTISAAQVRFLQSMFTYRKTPVIGECDEIGRAVGLTRRVVQVWFQNQRAKEKKLARMSMKGGYEGGTSAAATGVESLPHTTDNYCHLCGVEIISGCDNGTNNGEGGIISHIFSSRHLAQLLKETSRTDHRWAAAMVGSCGGGGGADEIGEH